MENKPKWISCYIFHNISFEKVLIELINPLIEELKENKYIDEYFFIRYWENGPHIRLRVLPKNKVLKNEIVNITKIAVKNYFESLEKELKYAIEFNDYIQEMQGYGGSNTIKIAEKHFQDSSNTVLSLISNDYDNWTYSTAISNAIQMHFVFAKRMMTNKNDTILYFASLQKKCFLILLN